MERRDPLTGLLPTLRHPNDSDTMKSVLQSILARKRDYAKLPFFEFLILLRLRF